MTGDIPGLVQRWRIWLVARWQRRWRLTQRGRVVLGSLAILLVLLISSLVGSWARDPPRAKGLPRWARGRRSGLTMLAAPPLAGSP